MKKKRIVISGMGVVTPIGRSVESFWAANLAGKSGLRLEDRMDLSDLPCGWVVGSLPEDIKQSIKARWGNSHNRWGDVLMLTAIEEALGDAGIPGTLGERAALTWARVWPGPYGSFPQDYANHLKNLGALFRATGNEPGDVVAYLQKQSPVPSDTDGLSSFPGEISKRLGAPLFAVRVDATCAGGLRAIFEAVRLIQTDKVDIAVVSASCSRCNHYTLSQYGQLMALSRWRNPPEQASMPFDKRRSGMVINESAGALVIESAEHAEKRGIKEVHAEIGGWGLALDTVHLTAPRVEMVERVMRTALENSSLEPSDIDTINAHATSTRLNDVTESRALHRVFGEQMKTLDVCAVKSLIGHGSAASGIVETVVAALTLCRGVIPPVVTCTEPDPECNVKTSLTPVERPVRAVLKNSFGFGGQYASVVYKRPENPRRASA
jgi:3-oxoacyl-[acyl-carrier-protein] synthase II